jgi:6-phosphogluconolactonase
MPGGSTPQSFFSVLCRHHLTLPVDFLPDANCRNGWQCITIAPTDERRAPEDDPACNASMIRSTLLQHQAQAAHFVGLEPNNPTPCVTTHIPPRPLDVAILGMGADGHIAGLFADGTAQGHQSTMHGMPQDIVLCQRADGLQGISFSMDALCAAKTLYILCGGEDKSNAMAHILRTMPNTIPLAQLLQRRQNITDIYMFDVPDAEALQAALQARADGAS